MKKAVDNVAVTVSSAQLQKPYCHVFGFPEYFNLRDRKFVVPLYEEEKSDVLDSKEKLFMSIFSVNPRTLLPQGDLALWLSDAVSPEIRDFISRNLMVEQHPLQDAGHYNGLDDDTIARFMRDPNEDINSYRDRVFQIVKSESEARIKSRQIEVDKKAFEESQRQQQSTTVVE